MRNQKTKILVCTHKKAPCLSDDVYLPIQVGRLEVDYDLGFQTDAEGINIGFKHHTYSEYTGIYWAWKNLKNIDYIGWCHYRRYFCLTDKRNFYQEFVIINDRDLFQLNFSTIYLNKYLKEYDIILPRKKVFPVSIWDTYAKMHDIRNMIIIESIIKEKYPDYVKSFNKILKENNRLEHMSIFVTRWDIFNDFCSWLFTILEQAEKNAASNNTLAAERSLAFIAERLMPVYIYHNKLKIKHLPVALINPEMKKKSWLRYHASIIKKTLKYWFNTK